MIAIGIQELLLLLVVLLVIVGISALVATAIHRRGPRKEPASYSMMPPPATAGPGLGREASLGPAQYCSQCGGPVGPQAKFCRSCGQPL